VVAWMAIGASRGSKCVDRAATRVAA